ncbi:DUF5872 domain-containing protein [Paludisphaera soli]|uniref:DUF5872 domain-containing protein n=1 Tax=Paludisphaera soli TaxID=2712865 RepID=UPI0013ED00D7|nr:DUF5872 domain-containing protein [Paludisphaera soli]
MPARKKSANKAPAKSARKSSPRTYTDPELRDRLKAEIQDGDKGGKAGEWSARKSQLLAAAYKKAGGGYTKSKAEATEAQKSLEEWTDEEWTTKDGEPAVREGETARYLPRKAWDELTPAEREATDAKKQAGSRAGEQFVANTGKAKRARKKASS